MKPNLDQSVVAVKKWPLPTKHHPEWYNTYWALVRTKHRPFVYGVAMVQPYLGHVSEYETFSTYRAANCQWWDRWHTLYATNNPRPRDRRRALHLTDGEPPRDRGSCLDAWISRSFHATQVMSEYDQKAQHYPIEDVIRDAKTDLHRVFRMQATINRDYLWRVWLPYVVIAIFAFKGINWVHQLFPATVNVWDILGPFSLAWGFVGIVSRVNQRRRIVNAKVFRRALVEWIHRWEPPV